MQLQKYVQTPMTLGKRNYVRELLHSLTHDRDCYIQKSDSGDLQAQTHTLLIWHLKVTDSCSPMAIKVVQTHSNNMTSMATFMKGHLLPAAQLSKVAIFGQLFPLNLLFLHRKTHKFTVKGISAAQFFMVHAFISFCVRLILWSIYSVHKVFRIDFHSDTLCCFYIQNFTCMTNNCYSGTLFSGAEVKANVS